MPTTEDIASAVQQHLQTVKATVNKIIDPDTEKPLQIPEYSILYNAAGQLDATPRPEKSMFMIQSLLGRASSVDMKAPTEEYPLRFPHDHHLHPDMGDEWYWIGCNMKVTDQKGKNHGRISMLLSMQKIRSVGLAAQKSAGWTDQEVTIACNVVTVTVDMGADKKNYHRRSPNLQWSLKGGNVNFSTPGPGQKFSFQCGLDSLSGSVNVLPLNVVVNDGDNMQIDIELKNKFFNPETETAHFLQGVPFIRPGGNGGTGITPIPTPGIYYSWPQLRVTRGTVTVKGKPYTIVSGTGWMDHQVMMTSLKNPKTSVNPEIPFVGKPPLYDWPPLYDGWVWQYFNLENGESFTGAGFVLGPMNYSPKMDYGYFLTPHNLLRKDHWTAIFINGDLTLTDPQLFPALCNHPKHNREVEIPISRSYNNIENIFYGHPLSGSAKPWYKDGTFNNPNGSLCAEFPADFTADPSTKYPNGLGYLETVGFEKVKAYRQYALDYLQGKA